MFGLHAPTFGPLAQADGWAPALPAAAAILSKGLDSLGTAVYNYGIWNTAKWLFADNTQNNPRVRLIHTNSIYPKRNSKRNMRYYRRRRSIRRRGYTRYRRSYYRRRF